MRYIKMRMFYDFLMVALETWLLFQFASLVLIAPGAVSAGAACETNRNPNNSAASGDIAHKPQSSGRCQRGRWLRKSGQSQTVSGSRKVSLSQKDGSNQKADRNQPAGSNLKASRNQGAGPNRRANSQRDNRRQSASPEKAVYAAAVLTIYLITLVNGKYAGRISGLFTCFSADIFWICAAYRRSLLRGCHVTALFYAANLLAEIWVITALALISDYDAAVPESGDQLQVLAAVASKLLVFTVIFIVRKWLPARFFESFSYSSRRVLVQTASGISILFITAWIIPIDRAPDETRILLVVQLAAAGMALAVISLFGFHHYREREALYTHQKKSTLEYNLFLSSYKKQLEGYEKELLHQAHDLRHHLQFVATILQKSAAPHTALNYMRKVLKDIPQKPLRTHMTGNQTVDAIILAKSQDAGQNCIQMHVQGRLSKDLNIEPTDLTSLLANLIENALEACLSIAGEGPDIPARAILINFQETAGGFYTEITNPLPKGKFRKIKRMRGKNSAHGHGLQIIDRITTKYNGYKKITIDDENNITFRVYLNK